MAHSLSEQSHSENALDHFPNFVAQNRLEYFPAIFFASDQRLRKFEGLLGADVAGRRGLVRVNNGLHDHWAIVRERFA